ncbi:MAG: hypothetical protein CL920_15925 [Deltaproteobacteria bacterium]|nr:hypothetical protein [Deltaproteobacteria bacterium]MBU50178.1 hypothetical protein [Deltaproteobacteria bacterium]
MERAPESATAGPHFTKICYNPATTTTKVGVYPPHQETPNMGEALSKRRVSHNTYTFFLAVALLLLTSCQGTQQTLRTPEVTKPTKPMMWLDYQSVQTAPAFYEPMLASHKRALQVKQVQHQTTQPRERDKDAQPPLVFTQQYLQRYQPNSSQQHPELPYDLRAMMPLHQWAQKLTPFSSPSLRSCRPKILTRARYDIGRRVFKCSTRHARAIRYRNDCSGWVRCVYAHFGVDLFYVPGVRARSGTYLLYNYIKSHGFMHRGTPAAGDLVFWHGTIDRNKNGRLDDDPLTHVGLVEGVDPDGRVRILHTGYKPKPGVHRIYMYLRNPSLHKKELASRRARPTQKAKIQMRIVTRLEHPHKCRRAKQELSLCRLSGKDCRTQQHQRRLLCKTKKVKSFTMLGAPVATHTRTYNSILVGGKSTRRPHLGRTTGELFAGFGTLSRCPGK